MRLSTCRDSAGPRIVARDRNGDLLDILAADPGLPRDMLDLIEAEMRVAMALTGVTSVDRIGADLLAG